MTKQRRRARRQKTIKQNPREFKRLEAIENNINDVLVRVDKMEKAFTNKLLPRATALMDNVNTVVEKSLVWLDIGNVLLALLAIFCLRCLRKHSGKSLLATCGDYLMGCMEWVLGLFCALQILAIVYKYVTGETMKNEMLMQAAGGVTLGLIILVVFAHYCRLANNQNNIGNRNVLTIYRQNLVAQAIG